MSEVKDSEQVVKAIIHSVNEFLVLRTEDPETYDLPGGHIHEDEGRLTGLAREVEEETGLKIDTESAEKLMVDENTTFYLVGHSLKDEISLSDEHVGYKALSLDDIDEEDFSEKYLKAVKEARKRLKDENTEDKQDTTNK